MSRIPTHTVDNAPAASQPLLQKIVQTTPGGRPAKLHAQMAHSPAVLKGYTSVRAVLAEQSTFTSKVGAALTLAAAAGVGNGYMARIAGRLAQMNGWSDDQITALATGTSTNDAKTDILAGLVREAAANSGNVADATWNAARRAGWNDEHLTDAFVYLGATVFTAYFLNYAQTDQDI